MKTLEDFETMTVPQLVGILNSLDIAIPKKARKEELVQLVYDTQQPSPDNVENETEKELETNKDVATQDQFERDLQRIVDHFNGTAAVEVDEIDDVIIFAIMDELTDEELARGTFLELQAQVAPNSNEPVDLDKEAGVGKNEIVEEPDLEEVVLETPPIANDENLAIIENGLKPLRQYGLKYSIDGSVIKLKAGAKFVTTTLNQPTHRVIRTAQQLCNQ